MRMIDLGSPVLLAIAGAAAVVAVADAARRRVRGRTPSMGDPAAASRERTRRARELEWAYDETAFGGTLFTLRGESNGVKWKVRYRVEQAESPQRHTLNWATRSVQGSATELRLAGRARHERDKAHGEPIIDQLSGSMLSARDIAAAQARVEFVARTPPVDVGGAAFRERYVVLARNQRLARALIAPKAEEFLIKWPGRPDARPEDAVSVWLDWQGLRVDVEADWSAMRDVEHLVALGVMLASGYRRHAAAPGVTQWLPSRPGHAT